MVYGDYDTKLCQNSEWQYCYIALQWSHITLIITLPPSIPSSLPLSFPPYLPPFLPLPPSSLPLPTPSTPCIGINAWNPSFDVTPCSLIRGIITEVGVAENSKHMNESSRKINNDSHCSNGSSSSNNSSSDSTTSGSIIDMAAFLRSKGMQNRCSSSVPPISPPTGFIQLDNAGMRCFVLFMYFYICYALWLWLEIYKFLFFVKFNFLIFFDNWLTIATYFHTNIDKLIHIHIQIHPYTYQYLHTHS